MDRKLIVIEGACDGVGKTTQYEMLIEHLKKDGFSVTSHHFPSNNEYQGLLVKNYLDGNFGEIKELSPYFVNMLYAADRGVTWYQELKKKYENKDMIVLDRYTTSSLIYQSALIEDINERKRFIDYVIDFEYNKIGIKRPDNVIFLYASFDLIVKLIDNRKREKDLHESNKEYMKKVYDNAMFVADYLSWNKIKCNNGDVMRDKEEIHAEIYKIIGR